MVKKNQLLSVHRCDICDFSTKNIYLYKRHKPRCHKDHGIKKSKGKYVSIGQVATDGCTILDTGNSADSTDDVDAEISQDGESPQDTELAILGELSPNEESLAIVADEQSEASMTTLDTNEPTTSKLSKAPAAVNRNYCCKHCDFKTTMSRTFLYHMVQAHKSNFAIYACTICEYCSQFRNKMQRHMKIAHKANVAYGDIYPEYDGGIKHRAAPVKSRKLLARNVAGKKLTVKFMKTSTTAASSKSTFKISSQLPVPVVLSTEPEVPLAQLTIATDHLSRIVDEIPSEEGGIVYKCKECQFIADDKQKVAKHAVSWHVDTKSFLCSYCDYITFERNDFLAHRLTHRNEHQFKCNECTYSTDFRPNYERHMNNHRQAFPFKCSFCSYGCGSDAATRRHMASNHDPVPPPAKKMKLPVPKSVKAGIDVVTTAESNNEEINTPAPTQENLSDDSKTKVNKTRKRLSKTSSLKRVSLPPPKHKLSVFEGALPTMVPMKSSVPMFSESYESSLSRESSPSRKLPQNITKLVHKENGKLVCPACKLKYNRSSDLNRHMKKKHGCRLREYLEIYTDTPIPVSGTYTDEIDTSQASLDLGTSSDVSMSEDHIESGDGVEFANEDNFGDDDDDGSPMDLSRNNEDESPIPVEQLTCRHCDFIAKWPSDLQRHMAVHSLEKRYQCNFCPRKYKYTGDLNVHIRKDHKKQPGELKVLKVATVAKKKSSPAIFKCPGCTYTSCWKSEVDRHSRLHSGEKTFQCRYCEYQSFWRGDIRRHMYKHHPSVMTDGVSINDVINIRKNIISQLDGVENMQEVDTDISDEQSMDVEYNAADASSPAKNSSLRSTPDRSGEDVSISGSQINRLVDGNTNESSIPRSRSHSPSPIQETGCGTYKCQYCGFVASAPSKMSSHIATHTNLKRYKCPICGRRANWKWDIAKHIKKDHNNHELQVVKLSKKEAEDTIKEYIESNPVLRRDHHLNITPEKEKTVPTVLKLVKCSACDFTADSRISVTRHIRSMHSGKEVNIVVLEKQKTPPQPKLTPQKTPQSSPNTSQHTPPQLTPQKLYTASPVSPNPLTRLVDTSASQDSARPFMCSECGKRGATKGDVKKHYHYVHSDKEIRIVYLGGGSQSVYATKDGTNGAPDNVSTGTSGMCTAEIASVEPVQMQPVALGTPMAVSDTIVIDDDDTTVPVINTKSVGYIRPFQCSVCSWRSNWRWALSKHIRDKHAGQNADIVILTEKEARATISQYIDKQIVEMNRSGIPANFKSPDATTKRSYIQRKSPLGSLKCSACAYRANQKVDVQRHIYRRHGAMRATVMAVEKESPESIIDSYMLSPQATVEQSLNVSLKPPEKKFIQTSLNLSQSPTDPLSREISKGPEKKSWKCSMCSYIKTDKLDVLQHIGKHNLKTYRCTACNFSSNFRSGVYRHIKSKHDGEMAFCRMSIKLMREGTGMKESDISPSQLFQPPIMVHSGDLTSTITIPTTPTTDGMLEQGQGPSILYYCKVCNFKSRHRSCVCRHILGKHKSKEYIKLIVKRVVGSSSLMHKKPQDVIVYPKGHRVKPAALGASLGKTERVVKRNFICSVCPYRTYKSKMLEFHQSCHKPQPGVRQVKCKYCPYYVSGARLLVQHTHLHTQGTELAMYPHTPVKKNIYIARSPKNPNAPKRHRCEKCPYASNSKNDFIYHKQFHRPKPTADYRCEYCEYWVTHKRLLKQHMKVHEDAGQTAPSLVAPSPAKSDFSVMSSENAFVYDVVEMAALKQRIISSKITPSISQTPIVSPMKLASSCAIGNKRGFLRKDGTYRKIHKCPKCPYMNIRIRNMRLHELMHGKRSSTNTLMKCLHCDYYVGSKGLLGHHLKVHQPNYGLEFTNASGEVETIHSEDLASEDSEMEQNISVEKKVDTLLEIARFKKYGCEKCPYASAKRVHFQRHMELHGSKQKCKCTFCDYSVPTQVLLDQHVKLHFEPNQNLLAAQSLLNLQHLPDMPADVALASMMINNDSKHPVSVTHDHVDLYENAPEDSEPKKIYRCDRCPYANIRRDHLLAHLRCHMVKNEHKCPYCDYSVGKIHVLVQHVKVHFNPLPELSEWLSDNGEMERMKQSKNKDMKEAIEVVHMYQKDLKGNSQNGIDTSSKTSEMSKNGDKEKIYNASCSVRNSVTEAGVTEENPKTSESTEQPKTDEKDRKLNTTKQENNNENSVEIIEKDVNKNETAMECREKGKAISKFTGKQTNNEGGEETVDANIVGVDGTEIEKADGTTDRPYDAAIFVPEDNKAVRKLQTTGDTTAETVGYVCQYCDRDFVESDHLVRHEMQHLIGNKYEDIMQQLNVKMTIEPPLAEPSSDKGDDDQPDIPAGSDAVEPAAKTDSDTDGHGHALEQSITCHTCADKCNDAGEQPIKGDTGIKGHVGAKEPPIKGNAGIKRHGDAKKSPIKGDAGIEGRGDTKEPPIKGDDGIEGRGDAKEPPIKCDAGIKGCGDAKEPPIKGDAGIKGCGDAKEPPIKGDSGIKGCGDAKEPPIKCDAGIKGCGDAKEPPIKGNAGIEGCGDAKEPPMKGDAGIEGCGDAKEPPIKGVAGIEGHGDTGEPPIKGDAGIEGRGDAKEPQIKGDAGVEGHGDAEEPPIKGNAHIEGCGDAKEPLIKGDADIEGRSDDKEPPIKGDAGIEGHGDAGEPPIKGNAGIEGRGDAKEPLIKGDAGIEGCGGAKEPPIKGNARIEGCVDAKESLIKGDAGIEGCGEAKEPPIKGDAGIEGCGDAKEPPMKGDAVIERRGDAGEQSINGDIGNKEEEDGHEAMEIV